MVADKYGMYGVFQTTLARVMRPANMGVIFFLVMSLDRLRPSLDRL
jgi:hypothetical protein